MPAVSRVSPIGQTHARLQLRVRVFVCVRGEVKWQRWATDLQLRRIMNDGKHLK